MLSRVAESLYWAGRYVERAEDVTRLLDVSYHALLEANADDRDDAWRRIVTLLGADFLYKEYFDEYTAEDVAEFLLWHPENPSSVAACVSLARENARSVREQISSEMWQAVNGLYLLVRGANRNAVARGPHEFFAQLRNGAHLFRGTVEATMIHGEPYEFIRLGLHLERAKKTTRIVGGWYPAVVGLTHESPEQSSELIALLESCGAFEAFLRDRGSRLEPWPVADYLLRAEELPRSVLHCLRQAAGAVARIAPEGGAPHRILGRLCAQLEYADAFQLQGPAAAGTLAQLVVDMIEAGDTISREYFSGQAILHGLLSPQEAQQQQCG
jgi:uncharacterized alpha-E superfamily protein